MRAKNKVALAVELSIDKSGYFCLIFSIFLRKSSTLGVLKIASQCQFNTYGQHIGL